MAAIDNDAANEATPDDFETRATGVDHQDLRLWLRMMALQKLIVNELRRRLRVSFGFSLARFDLMSQLDYNRAGMRIGELSDRLMVTTGNISGLVDELVSAGMVQRMPDPTSRRASLVRLTPNGQQQFSEAAKAHEGWIADFFATLSPQDKAVMFDLIGRQKSSVQTRLQDEAGQA